MFAMPLYTLGRYFGDLWVRKHLFDGGFLKPPSREVNREEQQRSGLQGYILAETIFNLQSHENFADIYDRIAKGEIEPCIGELEVARYFSMKGETFRFRKPIGRRGQDFDLEWLKDGDLICCEVETKLEARVLDGQGVWRTLDHARQQLPKDLPGIIFLRVLGHSDRNSLDSTMIIIKTAVNRLFRQSKRLLGVVLLTRVHSFSDDVLSMWPAWNVMANPNSQHPLYLLDDLRADQRGTPEHWTELVRFKPRFVFDWG